MANTLSFKKIWWLSLSVKLILSAFLPMNPDEAYYWVWSRHLQLSYFDHPPFVAWLFYLGHIFEPLAAIGIPNAVRWPTVIAGHLTLAVWFLILQKIFSDQKLKTWMWLMLFSPLMGFGSLIVTPDIAVVLFWSLSILFFQRADEKGDALSYILLGISLGLGFCSKYHIVLFIPAAVLYLLLEKKWQTIRWRYLPLTIGFGFVSCLPVLIWNYQHEWISFLFQLKHGFERESYDPNWTLSYLGGQILILFPFVLWAAVWATKHCQKQYRFLIYFGWLPLIFFFISSLKAVVEANWPIVAYPAVFALALLHPKIERWTKWAAIFFGTLVVVLMAAIFIPRLRALNEKINEPFMYMSVAEQVRGYKPMYAQTHQLTSMISYTLKEDVYKIRGINRFDFFDMIPESIPQTPEFYMVARVGAVIPAWVAEAGYHMLRIKPVAPIYELLKFSKDADAVRSSR
jgi:4-amino-4-deoxy-L-arabinose transferase-like glycosyltransferase